MYERSRPLRVNGKKHACSAAFVAQSEVAALRAGMRRGNLSAGAQKLNQPFSPSRVGAQKLSRPLGAGFQSFRILRNAFRETSRLFLRGRGAQKLSRVPRLLLVHLYVAAECNRVKSLFPLASWPTKSWVQQREVAGCTRELSASWANLLAHFASAYAGIGGSEIVIVKSWSSYRQSIRARSACLILFACQRSSTEKESIAT